MDAVYRVRKVGTNDELRYSLRSLSAFLPVDRVWIAGDKPRWATNVEHIPTNPRGKTYICSLVNLRAACDTPEVSESFVLLDDDFFTLRPCVPPVAHMGTIREVLPDRRDSQYRRGLQTTETLLSAWGYSEPLCYELHVPMVMTKTGVREVMDRAGEPRLIGVGIRSLFGNATGIGGERMDDVKIGQLRVPLEDDRAFVSTNDTSFRRGLVGKALRARFPEPSPYELT